MDKTPTPPETLVDAIRYFSDPDVCLSFMVQLRWPNGVSCPTCGSTRAVLAMASGHWEGAFRLNPLVRAGLLAGGLYFSLRLSVGLAPRLEATGSERQILLAAGLLALALNWA